MSAHFIFNLDQIAPACVGRFKGASIREIPHDLYIPPDALEVILDSFQGPLDLLWYVIKKHNIDVLDIPMAQLTKQYMGYVEAMKIAQLELAAEYLVMSAVLIEIKSRMLLPKPVNDEELVEDPRADLIRRLVEYENTKKQAETLAEMPVIGKDFSVSHVYIEQEDKVMLPSLSLSDLRLAWINVLVKAENMKSIEVIREELSIREEMAKIMKLLDREEIIQFKQVLNDRTAKEVIVVNFIAILELARKRLVSLTQQDFLSPIYLKLRL